MKAYCNARLKPPNATCGRLGYTLVELVVSTAIMAVLAGGMVSAILVATRAVPDGTHPSSAIVKATQAVDRIAGELMYAESVMQQSVTAVDFTVADRDADDAPERIRYAWSGTPGDPMTRQYNDGAVTEFVRDVNEFALAYDLQVTTEQVPTENETLEMPLIGYEHWESLADFSIDANNWAGQYFLPDLPADTLSWSVTRVRFRAKMRGQNDGVTMLQLRPATTGNLPSSTVLEERPMYESDLTDTYLWQEFTFSNVSGLAPSQGMCLVLQFVSADSHSCNVQYQSYGAWMFGTNLVRTASAGSSWISETDQSMLFHVYGTVTTPGSPETVNVYSLRGVDITLRVQDQPTASVQTSVEVLNGPEVTGS